MSNKRYHRNRGDQSPRSHEGRWIAIGAALMGSVVFIAALVYDILQPSTSPMASVRPLVLAIPAAVVGAMLGSMFTPRPPARRR